MPSREVTRAWTLTLRKELREVASSRAYWLMLLVTGLLVGHAFIDAMNTYAEASGAAGGPAALAQGLNPLSGIVVPVFGAYDIAATFLFPFVVIRLVANERETGVLALTLQSPVSLRVAMAAKGLALLLAWLVTFSAAMVALVGWRSIGGHLFAPEVLTVMLGHALRGVVTIGIASAAAALAAGASSAAIVALAVTIGTWALDYVAAARGGALAVVAQYTPSAALRTFEQGELRASTIVVMLALGVGGLMVASEWLRVGLALRRRAIGAAAVAVVAGFVAAGAANVRASRDVSEDRRNSFARADERALRGMTSPLVVTAHLAAEDPRLADLERLFAKLRRVMGDVRVEYAASGRSGLFARPEDHYGEVWYAMDGRRAMTRSATEEIVLETIYSVAGVSAPTAGNDAPYPGYPLAGTWSGATVTFFLAWPLLVILAWWAAQRRPRRRSNTLH